MDLRAFALIIYFRAALSQITLLGQLIAQNPFFGQAYFQTEREYSKSKRCICLKVKVLAINQIVTFVSRVEMKKANGGSLLKLAFLFKT